MAFFDDLSKKLTQAGQATIQKTKEIADITRINSNISDEEKRINNFYTEIGKLYVSLHSEDFENDFTSMFDGINAAQAKIKELKKELEQIKGVKKCPNCGAEVNNEAVFCSGCGGKMPQEEQEAGEEPAVAEAATEKAAAGEVIIEEKAEEAVKEETTAGEAITEEKAEEAATEETATEKAAIEETITEEVVESAAEENTKSCSNCGAQAAEGSSFCAECGTKL